jgi:hypothetical protein
VELPASSAETTVLAAENGSMTTSESKTAGNAKKLVQLDRIWKELLTESLRHGFFGTALIELNVQDGTIQHIRRIVDRMEK